MTDVLIKEKFGDRSTYRENAIYTKTAIYKPEEGPGADFILTACRRNQPCHHLDLGL